MKTVKVIIEGSGPMLMHSDRTANPLNPQTKALKVVTSKRKKTDEDHYEIARLEFIASCYYNGKWYLPSANIEAMLLASAKHFKMGTIIKQALIIPDDATFEFSDDKLKPEDLFHVDEYVDQRTVKISQAKNIRTRPIFNSWKSVFVCWLDTDKMNVEQLIQIIENAGKYVGIGDYRPRFGKFTITKTDIV